MPASRILPIALSAALLAPLAHAQRLDIALPAVLRQSSSVYPQCSGGEKARISAIIARCKACFGGACPATCCVEKPSSNQYVICDVPAKGAPPGCCVRVMGSTGIEIAASEVVTASGVGAGGICAPAAAGTESACPVETCAIAGVNKTQAPCPEGVAIPQPSTVYEGPAKCADGSLVSESATAPAATPVTAPAPAPVTAPPPVTAPSPALAAAAVPGAVPVGCKKTAPGFRCEGAVGYAAVEYLGGCCVGECMADAAKGWGKWCPDLVPGDGVADIGTSGAPASVPPIAPATMETTIAPPVANGTTVPLSGELVPVVVPDTSTTKNDADASPDSEDGDAKCFHSTGLVELEAGGTKTMADLSVGDRVKVGAHQFSEVFLFTHQDAAAESVFVNVTTQSGHHIVVTPGHYLFADGGLIDSSDVSVGDMLSLGDGGASAVVSVSMIDGTGLFNPQTLDGSIVVNGVKASTFTTAISPNVARTLLSPLRALYSLFGVSASGFERSSAISSSVVRLLPNGPSYLQAAN